MFQKFRGKNRTKIISIQKKTDVPGDSTQDAPEDSSHDSADSMDAGSIVRRTFTLGVATCRPLHGCFELWKQGPQYAWI